MAFARTGFSKLLISNPQNIMERAFFNCKSLISASIEHPKSMEKGVFEGCDGLMTLETDGRYSIPSLFGGPEKIPVSLRSIVVHGEYIVNNFCRGCADINEVTITNSIKDMGRWTFYGCKGITKIDIEEGLSSIGDWAFMNCENITEVRLPKKIQYIGMNAFRYCSGLRSVLIENNTDIVTFGVNAFYATPEDIKFYVPKDNLSSYVMDGQWQAYKDSIRGIE